MLEVNRPNRAARRLKDKSDPLDAYQAAQSVLDGRTKSIPKAKDGPVECLQIMRAGRTSAVKARTAAINQIKGLLVSSPDNLRAKYRGLGTSAMITALRRTRPSGQQRRTQGSSSRCSSQNEVALYADLRSRIRLHGHLHRNHQRNRPLGTNSSLASHRRAPSVRTAHPGRPQLHVR
ncbi:hypothetical protein [Arthrobacter methylotrophus]|uniref:hypothetical protein n=1 Tax=Arthrobacter methylotrophus TaxID=121291 RepID=UPI0031E8F3D0